MKDYYQILSVPGNATQQQIRKAYYKLAHQFHPDKSANPQHHQLFLEIKEAYEILGDKNKREIYHYRWQDYKNPPRPTPRSATAPPRPQARPARPTRHYGSPFAPPPFARHYQNYTAHTYKEFEPAMRQVCLISLLIGLLVFADMLLDYRLPNQVISELSLHDRSGRLTDYVTVFTQDSKFRIRHDNFRETGLHPGDTITTWKTPFFRQTTQIADSYGERISVNRASIYHNFFIILLAQLAFSAAGLYKKIAWAHRLNLGIMAGVFGALTLIILFISF
ncbi:MAG TPA: J domain-containing protein [Adhaeribacter sp.]|nr:J domain-containing protein [Adhaeribacter sp.]